MSRVKSKEKTQSAESTKDWEQRSRESKRLSSKSTKLLSQMSVGAEGRGILGQAEAGKDSGKKQQMKRLFHRLKENIGIAERTEFSKELKAAMEGLDRYKLCLDHLADTMCRVIQENPKHRTKEQQKLAPPQNEDEFEKVAELLKTCKDLAEYPNLKLQTELYRKLAIEHRNYLRRARRALHNIRTFIQHDYWVVGIQRIELDELRAEMDFAKSELKGAKEPQLIEMKNRIYNEATKAFQAKLKEVKNSMDSVPKNREEHIADILEWVQCTKTYHERMAKILGDALK
ncbi:unnamed protein product [Cylicocyclus nassatus]|uniref:BAR domain-containing protein n=1 Tax=Cylicocyclus nassatus TaxID=53992 RepID=A0AA36DSA1_CYLNA|nr:unnamed protein product [Cylicocyclus nassatus]